MSKVLATIDVDADFAYELEEAKLGNLYTEEAYVYFQRLQFKNLLNRFDVQSENSIEDAFVIAVGKEEIQKIFAEAEKAQTVGAVLYKDTRNVLPLFAGNAEIGGIGISFGKREDLLYSGRKWIQHGGTSGGTCTCGKACRTVCGV